MLVVGLRRQDQVGERHVVLQPGMNADDEIEARAAQRLEPLPAIAPASRLAAVLVPHHADAGMIGARRKAVALELILGLGERGRRAAPFDRRAHDRFRRQRARNEHRRLRALADGVFDHRVEREAVPVDLRIARHLRQRRSCRTTARRCAGTAVRAGRCPASPARRLPAGRRGATGFRGSSGRRNRPTARSACSPIPAPARGWCAPGCR